MDKQDGDQDREFAMMLHRAGPGQPAGPDYNGYVPPEHENSSEVPPKPVPGPYASLALIAERLGEIGSLLAGANQIELKKLQAWRERYEMGRKNRQAFVVKEGTGAGKKFDIGEYRSKKGAEDVLSLCERMAAKSKSDSTFTIVTIFTMTTIGV